MTVPANPSRIPNLIPAVLAGPSLGLVLVLVLGLGSCESRPRPNPDAKPASASPSVLASPATIAVTREDWTFEEHTGQVIATPSYRIYTTARWPTLLNLLPRFFESALDHYTTSITPLPRPKTPMDTYIMGTRPQWARLTQRIMGEDAEVYLRIQRGGFTASGRAILYFIGPRDTLAISSHEAWHQYTQTVFRNQLPVWMEEGLACFMEGYRWRPDSEDRPRFLPWANTERFDALRRAAREDRLVDLGDLVTQTPQDLMRGDSADALTFYAQCWALIHFLNEGQQGKYRAALAQILRDAADGRIVGTIQRKLGGRAASAFALHRRGPELLMTYVNPNMGQLQKEYADFVDALVRVSARDSIVQGRSPLAE